MNVKRRAGLTVATAGLAVGVLAPQGAAALPRPAGADRPQATIQVVAGGLNTPRGLIYDAATHDVLVAESGSAAGDTGKCGIGEGGGKLCFGTTGSIFAYNTVTGRGKEMITGLPSESLQPAGSAVLGLEALDLYKGQLNGVFGLLGFPSTRTAEGPGAAALGQVAHIASNGTLTPFGDIAKFEIKTYGKGEESDPYDLLTGAYGTLIVNAGGHAVNGNIGGNDVELVNPSGQLSQVAAFPQRYWKNQHILNNLIESVPTTAVKVGNAFYVGELSGAPYFQDSARIWRVVPGKTPHVFDYGFTNIISMTTDQSGNLIVLEIAKKGLSNADQTGALYKVSLATGQKTLLASIGLTNPGGVVEVGNVFYVTNYTTSTGGIGQLLKVTVPNP